MQTGNCTAANKHIEIFHPVDNEHHAGGSGSVKRYGVPMSGISSPVARDDQSAYSSRQDITFPHTSIHSENSYLRALITFPSAGTVLQAFRDCGLFKMPGTGFTCGDFLPRMRNQYSLIAKIPQQATFLGRASSYMLK